MENYDEIVGFDYTSENEWKSWIKEKFLPLNQQISIILGVRDYLESLLTSNFKEAFDQKSIQEILVGGTTEDGRYTPDSLAKFYKDVLGVYINLNDWVGCKKKNGLDPKNELSAEFEDTPFLAFLKEMKELLEKIFIKFEIEPQEIEDKIVEEIVNFPEKMLEVIIKIYKLMVSISANYDYHMFFILNMKCIPRFFIEKAYPRLKENFEKVEKILELEEKFVPNINTTEIKREYTLIGHKEEGRGDVLFKINYTLWENFNFSTQGYYHYPAENIKQIFSKVVVPEDLLMKFKEKVKKIIPEEYFKGFSLKGKLSVTTTKCSINEGSLERIDLSLVELFNKNAPHMFFSLLIPSKISENSIEFDSKWWY